MNKTKKIKKEKCLMCGKLTDKYWVINDDYNDLRPYHIKCRNKLMTTLLQEAGLKIKTKKKNNRI